MMTSVMIILNIYQSYLQRNGMDLLKHLVCITYLLNPTLMSYDHIFSLSTSISFLIIVQ